MPTFVTWPRDKHGDYTYRTLEIIDGACKFTDIPPIPWGDIDTPTPVLTGNGECVYDLQDDQHQCMYCADRWVIAGHIYIALMGNGWRESFGYPICPELGAYPVMTAKLAKFFERQCELGTLHHWHHLMKVVPTAKEDLRYGRWHEVEPGALGETGSASSSAAVH